MTIHKRNAALVLMLCGALGNIPAAHAQATENDVLRRTQMQLRQSEQERNSLRGEVARLQAQLDAQRLDFDRLRSQAVQVTGRGDSSAAELAVKNNRLLQATQTLNDTRAELEGLRADNTRRAQAVQNVQVMLANTQQNLALRNELVDLCRARNEQMYKVSQELVGMYRDKDFNSFAKREPVLQIQQVKLQNLMQEFEDRLRGERVYESTLPPSIEKQMQDSVRKDAATSPAAAGGTPPG